MIGFGDNAHGGCGGMSFVLSSIYSRLLSGTLGGYHVDGVLACMDDVVLMMLERGNK